MKTMLRFLLKTLAALAGTHSRGMQLPESPERLLLLMCHWIGDTFWALQVIPAIRKRYPDAEILVGIKESSRALFTGLLPQDAILIFSGLTSDRTREPASLRRFLKDVSAARKRKPELVIDTMGNRYSALFSFLSGAKATIGPDPADEFAALYSIRIPLSGMPSHHLVYKPALIASPVTGYSGKTGIAPFPVHSALPEDAVFRKWNPSPEQPAALLLPGAGWKRKQWSASRFRELAERLEQNGFRILLSGGPNDRPLCEEIAAGLRNRAILPPSLEEVIALLPRCSVVISNDSGVAHLAAAAGTRVIALFCCTNPEFCRPLGKRVRVLRAKCPALPSGGNHFCDGSACADHHMNITVEEVLQAVEELLRGRIPLRNAPAETPPVPPSRISGNFSEPEFEKKAQKQ